MNKKELEQMEKYWEKYHRTLPDYPIENVQRQRRIDQLLSYLMAFLLGCLFVLIAWLIYVVQVMS